MRKLFDFKRLIQAFILASVIAVVFSMIPFSAQCGNISGEVFRLHILADNDTQEAQSLKLKVRDSVLACSERICKSSHSVDEAERLTSQNLQMIADTAQRTVYKEGFDYPVKAEIKKMYFNTRRYGRVTMPSGYYNALRITLGEGKGRNWWCVMYPSLCVGASTNYSELKDKTGENEYELMTEGVEYRFKLLEYFNNFCSLFS